MSTFIFITHTAWREAPRIRHQLARLLTGQGHQVIFFERANYPWIPQTEKLSKPEKGITVVKCRNLIHHQLRISPPLDWMNAKTVRADLARWIEYLGLDPHAVVFNFAHDYWFLRELFPQSDRIITVIHDDWEAQARFPIFGHVSRNMRLTCEMSDEVFAVSTPLVRRLEEWCSPKLLPPWSVRQYREPHKDVALRNTLLFWGFIGSGLDTALIEEISHSLSRSRPDWKILMVGPSQSEIQRARITQSLKGFENITFLPVHDLDALPLDRVIVALIPYGKMKFHSACEIPNKTFHFLSRGIPILASGMPNLIEKPFIHKMEDARSFELGLENCIQNFNGWQPIIKDFVRENSGDARLELLGITRELSIDDHW